MTTLHSGTGGTGGTAPVTDPERSAPEALGVRGVLSAATALLAATGVLALVAGWHLTQGTTGVGLGDLVRLLLGDGDDGTLWDPLESTCRHASLSIL